MPGRNSQIARIYSLLQVLEGVPLGLTVSELTERLNDRQYEVSKRTVYRDLEAIIAAGFPIFPAEENEDRKTTRWILQRTVRIQHYLVLSPRELIGLYLAQGLLLPLKETPFFKDLKSVFQKIEEKIGVRGQSFLKELSTEIQFQSFPLGSLKINHEVLDAVRAGCAEGQILKVEYTSINSKTLRVRRLGPHYIYFSKSAFYLIAEDLEERKVKVFSIARMSKVEMLDEVYRGDIALPEKFFEYSIGLFQGEEPLNVKLEFSTHLLPYLQERTWHSSQKITRSVNGAVYVTFHVSITPELLHWILGFGAQVRVLEPKSLIDQVSCELKNALDLYSVVLAH